MCKDLSRSCRVREREDTMLVRLARSVRKAVMSFCVVSSGRKVSVV